MDFKLIFSLISAVIGCASFYPYIRDTIYGKTEPHLYTWLIWFITASVATAGVWYGGGGYTVFNMTIGTLCVLAVFLLCFFYGSKNITLSDVVVLTLALCAIVVWWLLQNPLLAVLLATGIDVLGYIPTYRKTYEEPYSETVISWVGFAIAPSFALLSLSEYNLLTTSYLGAVIVANLLVVAIALLRRKLI